MNLRDIESLLKTIKQKSLLDHGRDWDDGSETYLKEIHRELDEVAEELHSGRAGYLEEELGDVFWDYLNLLVALEQEGKIAVAQVFGRAAVKYEERVSGIQQGLTWAEVKRVQKERLAAEHQIAAVQPVDPGGDA